MAKIPTEGFSRAAIKETHRRMKEPRAKDREEKKRGVVFLRLNKVMAVIERHPAMILENQTDGCLPCHNGTANDPQIRWRRKGTGAPPPEPVPSRPRTPPVPADDSERTQSSETDDVPPRYVYIHTPLPSARLFNLDPYAKDPMRD